MNKITKIFISIICRSEFIKNGFTEMNVIQSIRNRSNARIIDTYIINFILINYMDELFDLDWVIL